MLTLAMDAATYSGSVALVDGGVVVAEAEALMRGERAERLMPAVADTLKRAGVTPSEVERVVCGEGPGSFTSLRIAASIAKGLAVGVGVPLYAVSSLMLVVAGSDATMRPGRYLAVLDAMRGDAFAAGYEVMPGGDVVGLSPPVLVSREGASDLADSLRARMVGPGEALVATPHARGVARLATWWHSAEPVAVASWEPAYGRLAEAQVRWEAAHARPLPRS
ncbi:MAG: tRNA (adenosine(37)-N6)-threonylcarbamoyltransferase complex dimerization subunit type 1 TsaB [Gemmatimonadaceae bacterium]